MGRDIRYFPQNSLVEVTDVCFQNRFMLRPSAEVNDRFLGVLGRAQKVLEMRVCAVSVVSNHYHLLLQPRDAEHLAAFMCFFKSNLSKQIGGALHGWIGSMFSGRYHLVPVSDEEQAQVSRLRYLLAHGVKERLVDRVEQWPGIQSASSLISGSSLHGAWHGRPNEVEDVLFSPLPCWQHLESDTWRRHVASLVDDINRLAEIQRAFEERRSTGITDILAKHPLYRPAETGKRPKPRFHAFDKRVRRAMVETWREICVAYREASQKLRADAQRATIPEGTFPPAGRFVAFVPS